MSEQTGSAANGVMVVEDVRKEYPDTGEVLRGVSFELAPGHSMSIVGPSGSGKSTLLNILGSLDTPTSGSVRLGATVVSSLDGAALAEYRARRVGFVFQDHHLLPQCTALENALLPTLALGGAVAHTVEWARDLLERVGLSLIHI